MNRRNMRKTQKKFAVMCGSGYKNKYIDPVKYDINSIIKENYDQLAKAIVEQAVDNYRRYLKIIKNKYADAFNLCSSYSFSKIDSIIQALDIEDFFTGQWCSLLTNIDGNKIINELREQNNDKRVSYILDMVRKERKRNVIKN